MEATLVVATIAQRIGLQLAQQDPIVRQNSFTGGPAGPVQIRPHARVSGTASARAG